MCINLMGQYIKMFILGPSILSWPKPVQTPARYDLEFPLRQKFLHFLSIVSGSFVPR